MREFRHVGTANLYERDGVFYFRRQLSSKLCIVVGSSEIRKSLRTRDLHDARERCCLAGFVLNNALRKINTMMTLNIEVVPTLARKYLNDQLDHFMTLADYGPQNPTIFNVAREIDDAADREAAYRQLSGSHGSTPYIEDEANKISTSANYDLASAKEEPRRHLIHCMLRAEAEVMRVYGAALSGKYDVALIQDPLFKGFVPDDPLATGISSEISGSISLEEVAEKFLRDKAEVLAHKSLGDFNRVLVWGKSWFGPDTALNSINIVHVRGFRDQLAKILANNSGPLNFTKANAKVGRSICPKTQWKYFGLLGTFF